SKEIGDGRKLYNDVYFDAQDTIYEDFKVDVQKNNYSYIIRGIDNCLDTTPYSNLSRSIVLSAYFDATANKPALKWNTYAEWNQGVSHYIIERKLPDGSFVEAGKVNAQTLSFIDVNAEQSCVPFYV